MTTLGRVLTDPTYEGYRAWQSIVTFFILASCVGLALETVPDLALNYQLQSGYWSGYPSQYLQLIIWHSFFIRNKN